MTNQMGLLRNLGDTTRLPSRNLWKLFPWDDIDNQRCDGIVYFNDFTASPNVPAGAEAAFGDFHGFASTGGSVTSGEEDGSTLVLSSDGDDEGASIGLQNQAFRISSGKGNVIFEARIKKSALTDSKIGVVCGMSDGTALSATVPIAADGTLADHNFVGFHNLEGDGDTFDAVYRANGVAKEDILADAVTVVADTYVKLGMKFDTSTDVLTMYKDGQAVASATKTVPNATGTDFPADVNLGFVFGVLNASASTPGSAEIDWVRIGQEII